MVCNRTFRAGHIVLDEVGKKKGFCERESTMVLGLSSILCSQLPNKKSLDLFICDVYYKFIPRLDNQHASLDPF